MNENSVIELISNVVRPIVKVADIFVFRRTPSTASTKEVLFCLKIKREEAKGELIANALMNLSQLGNINYPEKIEFVESTLDFNEMLEHEFFMVKATLWSGV